MGERARLRLKVRHHEVDAYGHVNHAHYVHYLETARVEVLESLGLGLPEMRRLGYLILAAELSVKYHAPAYAAETLEVATSIREIRGARSLWIQEIREVESDRLVVTAEVTGAFTAETGRPDPHSRARSSTSSPPIVTSAGAGGASDPTRASSRSPRRRSSWRASTLVARFKATGVAWRHVSPTESVHAGGRT